MAKTKTRQADGDSLSISFTRPHGEAEIDRYWRTLTETGVGVSRYDNRGDRNFLKSVQFEAIEILGIGIVFEFTDGKLTGIRK